MQKALLIAEKPSLMRSIEEVYNKHKSEIPYGATFTSQRGHLVTLMLPSEMDDEQKVWKWENLPFHPEDHGGWKYKIIQEKKAGKNLTASERFSAIQKELKSGKYDFVINAGDPDQEGELLIRSVLEQMGNTLPIRRFWTNDLTEKAILDALQNLRDDDGDPFFTNLYAASKGRQHSDYRFGMNLSEAASLQMEGRVAVGRVKTPILAIVCRREEEIRNFTPKTNYGVRCLYADDFTGTLFDASTASTDEDADEDKKNGVVWFETKKEAEDLIAKLPGSATVVSFEKKRVETYAPKLYKLATLQIDAGKLGYNDAQTLQIIQGLYEKQYLSYPRTDCEYLSSKEDFMGILGAVNKIPEFNPFIKTISKTAIGKVRATKKWINDKALEDAGHSAIRPTTKAPDMSSLTKAEQDIYSLVCRRFIAIFLPPIVQDKTQMVTDAGGHTFKSAGKTLVDPGFSVIFGTKFTDMVIPEKAKGDTLGVNDYTVTEKTTTCPKRYTSPGLIEVCENPGKFLDDPGLKTLGKRLKIGTPATRSSIIRTLIETDRYMEEHKEKNTVYIYPTATGETIIKNLGGCDICKVDLTGEWENQLEDVRQGLMPLADLENGMRTHVEALIDDIRSKTMTKLPQAKKKYTAIGKCPKCGKDICEGPKGFFCMGFRDTPKCNVGGYKEIHGLKISASDFLSLLSGGEIKSTQTKGSLTWEMTVKYDSAKGGYICDGMDEEIIGKCPKCGGNIVMTPTAFKCDKKHDVGSFRSILNVTLTGEEFMSMLDGQVIEKELQKTGKEPWRQKLEYSFKDKKVAFVQRGR